MTLVCQQFVPGDRSRILLPLVFCRECGQEYYCVRERDVEGVKAYEPRDVFDRLRDPEHLPPVLREVWERLNALALESFDPEQRNCANRALSHLYKMLQKQDGAAV